MSSSAMSVCLKLPALPSPLSSYLRNCHFHYLGLHGISASPPPPNRNRFRRLCSLNSHDFDVRGLSNAKSSSPKQEGSTESDANSQGGLAKSNEIVEKLRRYGIAGILSYGLLNTVYYLITFLVVWFYVAPAPAKMGYLAAAERFLKVMAMVWAGSQVTKIVRAGGALALAPFVDRGLSWFTAKFKFESQGQAFMTIVAFCLGLAILLFFSITLFWA